MAAALVGGITVNEGITPNDEGRIGVQVDYSSGKIGYVYKECPAREAGLMKGDKVIIVDGKPGYGKDSNSPNISGTPGTDVDITVLRGKEALRFRITRIDRHLLKR